MATGPYDLGPFQTLSAINFAQGGAWELVDDPVWAQYVSDTGLYLLGQRNTSGGNVFVWRTHDSKTNTALYWWDGAATTFLAASPMLNNKGGSPVKAIIPSGFLSGQGVLDSSDNLWIPLQAGASAFDNLNYVAKWNGSSWAAASIPWTTLRGHFFPMTWNEKLGRLEGEYTPSDTASIEAHWAYWNGSAAITIASNMPNGAFRGWQGAWNQETETAWFGSRTVPGNVPQIYEVTGSSFTLRVPSEDISLSIIWNTDTNIFYAADSATTIATFDGTTVNSISGSDIKDEDSAKSGLILRTYHETEKAVYSGTLDTGFPTAWEIWKWNI